MHLDSTSTTACPLDQEEKPEAPRGRIAPDWFTQPRSRNLRAVRHQQVGVQIVGGRVSSIAGSVRIASPISDLSALVPS
jgi:hypothetical protein